LGILSAVAHGALKTRSRLRSATETFCLSKVYLYFEPVKRSYKITDITPLSFFEGIREGLLRFYTASLWVEVVLKSFAAGERGAAVYDLLKEALRHLDRMADEGIEYLNLQYLWRYIGLAGYRPDMETCGHCGRAVPRNEALFLSRSQVELYCENCTQGRRWIVPAGARRYLVSTERNSLDQALRATLDRRSLKALKEAMLEYLQGVLETPLSSLAFVREAT
jgi:DNA repair protein RecO (recombination protein O)